MAEWMVKLGGQEGDLLDLVERLGASEPAVVKEADGFYLRSTTFESCTGAEDVRLRANDLVRVLNGTAALYVAGYQPVAVGHVARVEDDGRRHTFVSLTGVVASGRGRVGVGRVLVRGDGGPPLAVPPPSPVALALQYSAQAEDVERILRLYGSLSPTWRNLYLVLDALRDDVSGSTDWQPLYAMSWARETEIKRFKWTANSFTSLGAEARHGPSADPPPRSPMTLGEAQELIRALLRGWIASKTANT